MTILRWHGVLGIEGVPGRALVPVRTGGLETICPSATEAGP